MTGRIALAAAVTTIGGLVAVLFQPDWDGTAGWGIAVAVNGGLICFAGALLAGLVSRR
jgi:hypothetical protein